MITRLLDSVILIDHLNGIDQATSFVLKLNPEETAISVITRAEVLAGVDEEDQNRVSLLLDQYQLFIIDKTAADLSAQKAGGLEITRCNASRTCRVSQN